MQGNIKRRRNKRLTIYKRDGWRCWYCGRQVLKNGTLDHKLPLAKGGTSCNDNLVCSCRDCNTLKGNLTLEQFRAHKAQQMSVDSHEVSFWGEGLVIGRVLAMYVAAKANKLNNHQQPNHKE